MNKTLTTQYLALLGQCLSTGSNTVGRNGLVRKLWAPPPLVVPSVAYDFPLLQDRPHAFYKSVLETCFFLSGKTSYDSMPEVLRTSWWKPWAAAAEAQGSWGSFYGSQWRHQVSEQGPGFDALQHLLNQLKEVVLTGVENRKMVVSLWHTPDTLSIYAQTPAVLESCHSTCLVFDLAPKLGGSWVLNLHHTQRSLDLINGTAADLIYSGLVMKLICDWLSNATGGTQVEPGCLVFAPVNVHIYENHWAQAQELACKWPETTEFAPVKAILLPIALGLVLRGEIPMTIPEAKALSAVTLAPPRGSSPQTLSNIPIWMFPLNA
jgi:thymidylate synthase